MDFEVDFYTRREESGWRDVLVARHASIQAASSTRINPSYVIHHTHIYAVAYGLRNWREESGWQEAAGARHASIWADSSSKLSMVVECDSPY